jgi:hypothetical protein
MAVNTYSSFERRARHPPPRTGVAPRLRTAHGVVSRAGIGVARLSIHEGTHTMTSANLSAQERARILAPAAALFALGLVIGLIFTFKAIGHVAIWPLLPALDFDMPGTEAAWRRTHLGALMNAIAMIAFALAGSGIRLGAWARQIYIWSVCITGWGNTLGFLVGALFGVRGLAFGASWANSVNYLLFLIAALTAFAQAWLLWQGARAQSRAAEA